MSRIAFAVALAVAAASPLAAQQHVVSCPGVTGGPGTVCDGFTLGNVGRIAGGTLTVFGDEAPTTFTSPTPFTFVSAVVQSALTNANVIVVRGFTRPFDPRFPIPCCTGGDFQAQFTVGTAPQTLTFGWGGVVALTFDSFGGPYAPPGFPAETAFQYSVSAITVATTTPEPASLVLLATGLLAVLGARRRRQG